MLAGTNKRRQRRQLRGAGRGKRRGESHRTPDLRWPEPHTARTLFAGPTRQQLKSKNEEPAESNGSKMLVAGANKRGATRACENKTCKTAPCGVIKGTQSCHLQNGYRGLAHPPPLLLPSSLGPPSPPCIPSPPPPPIPPLLPPPPPHIAAAATVVPHVRVCPSALCVRVLWDSWEVGSLGPWEVGSRDSECY